MTTPTNPEGKWECPHCWRTKKHHALCPVIMEPPESHEQERIAFINSERAHPPPPDGEAPYKSELDINVPLSRGEECTTSTASCNDDRKMLVHDSLERQQPKDGMNAEELASKLADECFGIISHDEEPRVSFDIKKAVIIIGDRDAVRMAAQTRELKASFALLSQAKEEGWRPIDKDTPFYEEILCYHKHDKKKIYRVRTRIRCEFGDAWIPRAKPTHWQPLPAAPQASEGGQND